MFWVLLVVSYRMIKGTNQTENQYTQIVLVEEIDQSEEESAPAPPYADVKADPEEAK